MHEDCHFLTITRLGYRWRYRYGKNSWDRNFEFWVKWLKQGENTPIKCVLKIIMGKNRCGWCITKICVLWYTEVVEILNYRIFQFLINSSWFLSWFTTLWYFIIIFFISTTIWIPCGPVPYIRTYDINIWTWSCSYGKLRKIRCKLRNLIREYEIMIKNISFW